VILFIFPVIWIFFDLAQTDVVVRDQSAVRKSVAAGFRHACRHLFRLLAAYSGIALVGLLVLVAGVWVWHALVRPRSMLGAFFISEVMLIVWLWARFWQRASAVAYYLRESSLPVPVPIVPEPAPLPESAAPLVPPAPEGAAPA